MVIPPIHHVLVRDGDGTQEVEAAVRAAGTVQAAGLHKYFFVARANQTVVLATGANAAIVVALRGIPGWREPVDEGAN